MEPVFEVVETPTSIRSGRGGLISTLLNALESAGPGHSVKIPLSEIKLASMRSNLGTLSSRRGYAVSTSVREGHLYVTKKA